MPPSTRCLAPNATLTNQREVNFFRVEKCFVPGAIFGSKSILWKHVMCLRTCLRVPRGYASRCAPPLRVGTPRESFVHPSTFSLPSLLPPVVIPPTLPLCPLPLLLRSHGIPKSRILACTAGQYTESNYANGMNGQ